MMIRRVMLAVLATVFVAAGFCSAAEGVKIAVVRIQDAFKQYERTNQLQKDIEDTFKPQQDAIKRLAEEMKQIEKEIKTDTMLQPGSFEHFQKVQDMQAKKFKYETLTKTLKKEYNERMVEFYKAIYYDFQNAVAEYARNNGCDLVIRKASDDLESNNVMGIQQEIAIKVVQFSSDTIDCTNAVVEIMNRKWRQAMNARKNAAVGR